MAAAHAGTVTPHPVRTPQRRFHRAAQLGPMLNLGRYGALGCLIGFWFASALYAYLDNNTLQKPWVPLDKLNTYSLGLVGISSLVRIMEC